jgi:hypothetical protein
LSLLKATDVSTLCDNPHGYCTRQPQKVIRFVEWISREHRDRERLSIAMTLKLGIMGLLMEEVTSNTRASP